MSGYGGLKKNFQLEDIKFGIFMALISSINLIRIIMKYLKFIIPVVGLKNSFLLVSNSLGKVAASIAEL